jgi:hypothetical protein
MDRGFAFVRGGGARADDAWRSAPLSLRGDLRAASQRNSVDTAHEPYSKAGSAWTHRSAHRHNSCSKYSSPHRIADSADKSSDGANKISNVANKSSDGADKSSDGANKITNVSNNGTYSADDGSNTDSDDGTDTCVHTWSHLPDPVSHGDIQHGVHQRHSVRSLPNVSDSATHADIQSSLHQRRLVCNQGPVRADLCHSHKRRGVHRYASGAR